VLQQDSATKELSQTDLKRIVQELDKGKMEIPLLKELTILSSQNPIDEEASTSAGAMEDMWEGGALFRKVLASLFQQLTSDKVSYFAEFSIMLLTGFYSARGSFRIWLDCRMGDARKSADISRGSRVRVTLAIIPSAICEQANSQWHTLCFPTDLTNIH